MLKKLRRFVLCASQRACRAIAEKISMLRLRLSKPKSMSKKLKVKLIGMLRVSCIYYLIRSKLGKVSLVVIIVSGIVIWVSDSTLESKKYLAKALFDNAESIAIISAAVIFILEIPDRQKREHYEAWQIINIAQGQTASGGRIQALEDLNQDAVVLEGVSAPQADLSGINLRFGKLSRANFFNAQLDNANFFNAQLDNANFQEANLQRATLVIANLKSADLQGADLQGADLQGADLWDACLIGAKLQNAQLQGTTLALAKLQGADLQGAIFQGAILQGANLEGANLRGANLEGAIGLTVQQLSQTKLCKNRNCIMLPPQYKASKITR